MWEFDSEVSQIIKRTPTIKSFQFPIRARGVQYKAGQFFYLTIKVNDQDAIHHFSFSNSPADQGYVEFTKRITSSAYSQALDTMRPGAWGRLSGPDGDFTLPRKPRKIAFLSGGIGITPLRSMLRYITHKELPFNVVLLYSNSSIEEIAFREELDEMGVSRPGIRVEYVLSGKEAPPGWTGRQGLINRDMISESVPDFKERPFYVSGPPKMVIALETQLLSLGLNEKQVKRDTFIGYD